MLYFNICLPKLLLLLHFLFKQNLILCLLTLLGLLVVIVYGPFFFIVPAGPEAWIICFYQTFDSQHHGDTTVTFVL